MDVHKKSLSYEKYKLPNHWLRTPLQKNGLPYFGYMAVILDELPRQPVRVLDAGCGDGRISAEISRRGHAVVGLDFLELPIIYARNMVPQAEFFVGDLRQPLRPQHESMQQPFDIAVMVEVYEHIPPEDCLTVLGNLRQVMSPNGTLIISVPSKQITMSDLHYRHFDENDIRDELMAAGFQVQKMLYQHKLTWLTKLLLHNKTEAILDNSWLQPVFLKRLRERIYMNWLNVSAQKTACGRYIAIAQKTEDGPA
jgi:2-polyprenyl-3-methyl-5-hydroxy-6-metoxy-1,4-benzoquinol methylase